MRIAVLTSVETRHRYFARALRARGGVVAVGYEETGYQPAHVDDSDLTPAERQIVRAHFEERARQEEAHFGYDAAWIGGGDGCSMRRLAPGTLNTPETLAWLAAAAPDVVVVYGTNLIRPPLLGCRPGRMINLHLGLSPYYRGTATNFYPLVNGEPQYVGATIHLVDAGIDRGPILAHARPEIVAGDRPHTIGCQAIRAGTEAMIAVLDAMENGEVQATPQWAAPNARLYLRRDYHPRHVVELYRRMDAGLIEDYLLRAAALARALRLVETPRRPRETANRTPATAAG